ncbi:MAG: hypothetical protein GY763_05075 [Gammaproteobacteria bacterium]|nr:hypothetical protein [Gammaproteobacteria bacterium]
MPYYIYQIEQSVTEIVKNLSLVTEYEDYKDAKVAIRNLRARQQKREDLQWKMVFADSELEAEELLQEKREAPILMEWEK